MGGIGAAGSVGDMGDAGAVGATRAAVLSYCVSYTGSCVRSHLLQV